VRANAAANAFTPPDALAQLAASGFVDIRSAAAQNYATPTEALTALADDESPTVLQHLSKNPNTPPEVLSRLGRHEYTDVRLSALSAIEVRLGKKFGIDSDNEGALEFLRDHAWWDLTPESPEVVLAKTLSPNQ